MLNIFYGSLKRGFYNYDRFDLKRNSEYIGDIILDGYEMYDLGNYPAIVKKDGSKVTAEVFDVEKYTLGRIDFMEKLAGYSEEIIDTKFGKAKIYYMESVPSYGVKIKNGTWNELNL